MVLGEEWCSVYAGYFPGCYLPQTFFIGGVSWRQSEWKREPRDSLELHLQSEHQTFYWDALFIWNGWKPWELPGVLIEEGRGKNDYSFLLCIFFFFLACIYRPSLCLESHRSLLKRYISLSLPLSLYGGDKICLKRIRFFYMLFSFPFFVLPPPNTAFLLSNVKHIFHAYEYVWMSIFTHPRWGRGRQW